MNRTPTPFTEAPMPSGNPIDGTATTNLLARLLCWMFGNTRSKAIGDMPGDLNSICEQVSSGRPRAPLNTTTTSSPSELIPLPLLAQVATGLWRIRKRLLPRNGTEPTDDFRPAFRHLESTMDVLNEHGVEIREITGQRFVSGMALKIIAFQPTPGVFEEVVLETIKPTIFFHGQLIQMGEVIVGVPEATSSTTIADPAPTALKEASCSVGLLASSQSSVEIAPTTVESIRSPVVFSDSLSISPTSSAVAPDGMATNASAVTDSTQISDAQSCSPLVPTPPTLERNS